MRTAHVTRDQLFAALYDALGKVHEFDELDDKLAVFGLQTDDVHDLLNRRWQDYLRDGACSSHVEFVRGFVEGLLTGLQLGGRS